MPQSTYKRKPEEMRIVQVIAYLAKDSTDSRLLERIIRSAAKEREVSLCRSLKDLKSKLRLSQTMDAVVVLRASGRKTLSNLVALHDHLDRFETILIVPDAQRETIAKAHRLKPRYVGMAGGDFADIEIVLRRMLARADRREKAAHGFSAVKRE
ncbi:MAG: hypothetical protein C4576_24115 [Desulfobacteraceae bacterium]|nr:MAG: hypothetical protein C4576_24115 [Desulfobacteraceae bacterium]